MIEPKDLSNQELVDEFYKINKVGLFEYYSDKYARSNALKDEILRRLNEGLV